MPAEEQFFHLGHGKAVKFSADITHVRRGGKTGFHADIGQRFPCRNQIKGPFQFHIGQVKVKGDACLLLKQMGESAF